jgi:two-component system NtrC family sensor kinase
MHTMPSTVSDLLESSCRALFHWSRDAVILADPQGRIQEMNPAAERIFGCSGPGGAPLRRRMAQLFERRGEWDRFRHRLGRKGPVKELETRLLGTAGRVLDCLLTAGAVGAAGGEAAGYLILVRDISSQKQAQEEIHRQNTRLATLHSVSTALSSSLNLDEVLARTIDQILYILEAASVRVYMLDEEQQCLRLAAHKGVSGNFINRTEFRIRQVGDGLLGQTILTRQTKVVDNYLRADDPYVESIVAEGLKSSVYIPLFSKERPVGVLCVSSHYEYRFSPDFVEFLTAIGNQIGVAIENANLYHSLRRAYEELTQAQEQVIRTEKLASLGKLAATIAHEINNPLSVVLTYIKLIRKLADSDQLTPQRAPDITRYLTTMASETARCGEIVKNLLAFARHSKVTMEGHEAGEIIQRTVTLVAHDLQMKEMKLALDLDPHLPRIRCDFRQIQQALLNLLINAIEAMGKGGVLTISARRAPRDGFVAVAVSDTGCGIPEKNLESIFEPFFTTKAEAAGVGLGLSVVYGIVTKHGGTVEVRSREGRGSTFEIHLPAET